MKVKASKRSKESTAKKREEKDFFVVGLGASAGGVKALQEFFATMPPNSGMAFVVILHLSPEHESRLPEILQTQTQMPVLQVTETIKVEPNHVYVIPPRAQLEMVDGVVRPAQAERPFGHRVAIDLFFRTLAEAYQRNAVCIVLSGTGSDGTLGLKRVKEGNGFAIVQSPDDAEYDEMPRHAIATQMADWVLPVAQMPESLISFQKSSKRLHLMKGDDEAKAAEEIKAADSLKEILALLRVRTGHDFSNYKTPTLVRRIARHLQIHELPDIPAFLEFLRRKPEEIHSLLKNLLINVTNFFRDREAFASLEREVIPNLFADKTSNNTVRVWVAGCASGEEAYSMAILLSEFAQKLTDPPKIQIFASDVDDESIAEAREHRFPETIEADVSPERLRMFFYREGKYYRIKKELREMILFAPHNVLRDPPFSRLDLVSCRNLLIYLNRETQEKVLNIFHFAVNTNGFLFLGNSETADSLPDLFAPVDKKHRIYLRRPAHIRQATPLRMPLSGKWQVSMPEVKKRGDGSSEQTTLLGELHYKLVEEFAPPSILVNEDFEIVHLSESAGRYLRFTGGEPSKNLIKAVLPDLLPDLRAALFSAQHDFQTADFKNIRVRIDDREVAVNIIVRPINAADAGRDFLLVIFDEAASSAAIKAEEQAVRTLDKDEAVEAVIRRLEEDLRRTKEHLRTTIELHEVSIEELKASNEELQAINEEVRSASEELETSKEELQSVNEELTTVNNELKEKIEELSRSNSDFLNLMSSTNIGTLFLDRALKIKMFTPHALDVFNLIKSDIGRPLSDITGKFSEIDLVADVESVLLRLQTIEREIKTRDGLWYLMRVSPYRTVEDRIDGVVVTFLDITSRRRREEEVKQLAGSLEQQARVFDTTLTSITDFAYIFDRDGRFLYANQPLLDLLNITLAEITGKNFFDLNYPEDLAARLQKQIQQVFETRKIIRDETPFTSPGGKDGIYEYIFTPVIGEKSGAVEVVAGSTRDVTERKRTELKLRENRERLQRAMNTGRIFSWEMNPATRKLEWSSNMEAVIGFPLLDNIDRTFTLIHADDIESTVGAINQAIGTGELYESEYRLVNPANGEIFWLHSQGAMTTDTADGQPRFVGITQNVTERKKVELNLLKSEESLRITVDAAEMGTWTWNLPTDEVFWNERHFLLFGMKPENTPLKSEVFFSHVHPEDREMIREAMEKTISEKVLFEAEFRVIRDDGAERWMSGYGQVIEETDDRVTQVSGVMFDITERKKADTDLRESEERLQMILESAKDYAIFTMTNEGLIDSWSAGAERVFGYTESEIIGREGDILFTAADRAAQIPQSELKRAVANGRAEHERWHVRRDGTQFYASGVVNVLSDGEIHGFVKIARDMTEKNVAENATRDKEMLQRIISGQEDERRRISCDLHDHLGQQMTALRLKIEAVKKICGEPAVCNGIEEAGKIAEHLDSEVDFLAWELRPAALDDLGLQLTLNNYVREWADHTKVKAEFHTTGIGKSRLGYEIETNLYRIAQEAMNNIYKHAKAKMVSVMLEKRKDTIFLIIEDDGIGFNIKTKKNRQKGLGLIGMSERAAILGGTLEIESTPKQGTTIFVRVPSTLAQKGKNDK